MRPLILVFFLFITLMDSYFYGQSLQHYRYIVEPLLIPSLFLYYLLSSKKRTTLVLFAFLFVWLGDVLLMIERSPIFLQLAVFFYWIMQLCFLAAFTKFWKLYSFKAHFLGLLIYGSYLAVFLNHVYASLGEMKLHGLVYGLTLSIFGSISIMNLLINASKKNYLLCIGILIFSIRDVFLTYNKKYFNEEVFTFSIPILHGIGFFLIIRAFLYFEEQQMEPEKISEFKLER
jgi:hypothetical protein